MFIQFQLLIFPFTFHSHFSNFSVSVIVNGITLLPLTKWICFHELKSNWAHIYTFDMHHSVSGSTFLFHFLSLIQITPLPIHLIMHVTSLFSHIHHWVKTHLFTGFWFPHKGKERKGKEAYLYSAFYILCISQSAQAWITQFYLQIHHACLFFVCVHQMAPPLTEVRDI